MGDVPVHRHDATPTDSAPDGTPCTRRRATESRRSIPATAGGDAYDFADVGLTHARFVRIRDKSGEVCPDAGGSNADGFDLDAVSIVNAELP